MPDLLTKVENRVTISPVTFPVNNANNLFVYEHGTIELAPGVVLNEEVDEYPYAEFADKIGNNVTITGRVLPKLDEEMPTTFMVHGAFFALKIAGEVTSANGDGAQDFDVEYYFNFDSFRRFANSIDDILFSVDHKVKDNKSSFERFFITGAGALTSTLAISYIAASKNPEIDSTPASVMLTITSSCLVGTALIPIDKLVNINQIMQMTINDYCVYEMHTA